jgi:hypothetical protein
LLRPVLRPDRVHPLYGFHYSVQRAVARMTNLKFFKWLCGDSSYIVGYLRAIGYDLGERYLDTVHRAGRLEDAPEGEVVTAGSWRG